MRDVYFRLLWFIGVFSAAAAVGAFVIGGILSLFLGRDMWVGALGGTVGAVIYFIYLFTKDRK